MIQICEPGKEYTNHHIFSSSNVLLIFNSINMENYAEIERY